jgi:hypothetical protein
MKNNDPLDQKIDALLASRPLKPSDDFAARVLAQAEADTATAQNKKHPLGTLLTFALPIAAAIALTFSLLHLRPGAPEPVQASTQTTALNSAEAQEIFLLQESLSSLATLDITDFGNEDLLSTLDALFLEI